MRRRETWNHLIIRPKKFSHSIFFENFRNTSKKFSKAFGNDHGILKNFGRNYDGIFEISREIIKLQLQNRIKLKIFENTESSAAHFQSWPCPEEYPKNVESNTDSERLLYVQISDQFWIFWIRINVVFVVFF